MSTIQPARLRPERPVNYKWIALSNTTIGILMATIDSSIVLISLPAIFRGIHIDPLVPGNTDFLLWMLMSYMVVTAVLVVSFGRIGDMFGRVRMYNLGFAIFTAGSLAASLTYFGGSPAAVYLIAMRVVQGVGGAMIMANSTAILTDAFPEHERGMALGVNSVAGIAGSFIGLIAGGLLAAVDWHLIFYVSVPIGLFGTVWAYLKLQEVQKGEGGSLDLPGNVLFGVGLIAVLVGITYALQPYGHTTMGWASPVVLALVVGGVALLVAFVVVETKVASPMFDVRLFRIRAFAAGNFASLMASIGRGGLMFMLIIWLQGIWLPLHGYSFTQTPLWAGIYMLPLTAGFLVAGPISGYLSDRFGARPFATGGMVAAAVTFGLLMLLPTNFGYAWFALLLLCNGLAMGLFAAPNTAGIMNAVPPNRRGVASGMRSTFQNAGMTLSIGLFFTIMVVGLSSTLPVHLSRGLVAQGLPAHDATRIASLPPVSVLFAAFLGYNPMRNLLGGALATLSPAHRSVVTGHAFFSDLIAAPFHHGLTVVFTFALCMCALAAVASWLRGARVPSAADIEDVERIASAAEAVPRRGALPAVRATRRAGARGDGRPAGRPAFSHRRPEPAAPRRRVSVVTVSGSFGSGGGAIARAVADRLGLPFVDRAVSARVADLVGTPADGSAGDVSGKNAFTRSLIGMIGAPVEFGTSGIQTRPTDDEDAFRAATDKALRDLVSKEGGVILGRGGALVLGGYPGALHVRLDGPPPARAKRAMEVMGVDEATAWDMLRTTDAARTAYLEYLYGKDPADPSLYHLILDTTAVPPELAVETIVAAATAAA